MAARYGVPERTVQIGACGLCPRAERYPHLHAFVSNRAARGEKSR